MGLMKLVITCLLIGAIVCPPVQEKKKKKDKEENEDMQFGLDYERYLKEVVSVLETDDTFRKQLEEAQIEDIKDFISLDKTGDIAQHLDLVNHNVRTKLDEIKRREVERLNQIKKLLDHRKANGNGIHKDTDHEQLSAHIDRDNPETFEVEDLRKLINRATTDLEDLDKERKKEFKNYEMEKEMLRKQKLKEMDQRKREEEEKRYKEMQEKHKKHPQLNHPGGRKQLEEVWEDEDGLDKEDFNPKTFFKMHDTNGDGVLDMHEVEALFQHELDKVYDPDAPEDDMMERYEEMNRMREHVMKEVDKDQNGLISLSEFIESANDNKQEDDEGWEGLDEQDLFTDDEFEKYEQEYLRQREALQKQKQEQLRFEGQGQPQGQGQVPQMNQGQHKQPIPPVMHAQNQQQQQQQQIKQQQFQQQQQQHMGGNQVPVHPAMKHKPQHIQEQQQWQQQEDNSLKFKADSQQFGNQIHQNLQQGQEVKGHLQQDQRQYAAQGNQESQTSTEQPLGHQQQLKQHGQIHTNQNHPNKLKDEQRMQESQGQQYQQGQGQQQGQQYQQGQDQPQGQHQNRGQQQGQEYLQAKQHQGQPQYQQGQHQQGQGHR